MFNATSTRLTFAAIGLVAIGLLASCEQSRSEGDWVSEPEATVETEAPPEVVLPANLAFEKDYGSMQTSAWTATGSAIPDPVRTGAATIKFSPNCSTEGCNIWSKYRAQRPFPLQTLAFANSSSGGVLIITEPALSRDDLEATVRDIFGDDVGLEAQRWMVGLDGWLGDLVVTLPAETAPATNDPLDDEVFRDRLSLLAEALWGTSFGLYLDDAKASWSKQARSAAPNLSINPVELQAWIFDPDTSWRDPAGGDARNFTQIAEDQDSGTFIADPGTLVVFLIEGQAIRAGSFPERRADFRRFAVLSDIVIGAVWNETTGDLAIVGRKRQLPISAMQPLRFETLASLAAQKGDSLSQSYERTLPLAGKLPSGIYAGKDWAPIYLSYDLIDTEYGALLNITDQMLKSWSSAGEIQYVYFDYPLRPAPGQFVFGKKSISSILHEKSGGSSVLFNWNTAGGAAIVTDANWSILSPTKTSSLPITYGAELVRGEGMQMGDLTREYEDQAYDFYSNLGDPNLARVVSYATIFQALRANPRAPRSATESIAPQTEIGLKTQARAKAGVEILSQRVADSLRAIETGNAPDGAAELMFELFLPGILEEVGSEFGSDPASSAITTTMLKTQLRPALDETLKEMFSSASIALAAFKSSHPDFSDNLNLAKVLVDRGRLPDLYSGLRARELELGADIRRHNSSRFSSQSAADASESAIRAKESRLAADFSALESLAGDLERLRGALGEVFSLVGQTEDAKRSFIEAHSGDNIGWIRTPSIVLSWSEKDDFSVGGHNLDARALRIEVSDSISSPKILDGAEGPVLRVPPEAAASARYHANEIARMIEHGKADEAALSARLTSFTPPSTIRKPVEVLGQVADETTSAGRVRGGMSMVRDASARDVHIANRAEVGNPTLFAERTPEGTFRVSFRRGTKIECCTDVEGFSQFSRLVEREAEAGGDIVTVGFPEGQVNALKIRLSNGDRKAVSEALGAGGGKGKGPPGDNIQFFSGERNAGGGGPRTPGDPPASSGGKDPIRVSLVVTESDQVLGSIDMLALAKQNRKFKTIDPVSPDESTVVIRESRFPAAEREPPEVFRITFEKVDDSIKSDTFAIADLAPELRAEGTVLVKEAISGAAKTQTNLLDLTAEAKTIIARNPNRSAIRRLWIWSRESDGAYHLTELKFSGAVLEPG